ncbi:DUF4389 domain-containing protein [Nakamurella sp. GG22]
MTSPATTSPTPPFPTTRSPVRLQGRLDEPLSRGLWLVKWLLLIPHLIVLALLWVAFWVLTVIAFFAILFTGRYPRPLFDFNVGVLRWTWRVAYYGYGALGTDRYPPFSLEEHPEYPATLDVTYPQHLTNGLVLVKWLLALPQLIIVTVFIGGSTYLAAQAGQWLYSAGGGLVSILVCFAAIALLFTGRYPRGLFDFILGLDRWVLRVGAYVLLMTDEYPPFRLDAGGEDPTGFGTSDGLTATMPAPAGPPAQSLWTGEFPPPPPPRAQARRWSAGSVAAILIGSLLVLGGLGSAAGGTAIFVAAAATRADDGSYTTPTEQFSGSGYAIEFGAAELNWTQAGWAANADWLGQVRATAENASSDVPVFVGIARTADVSRYLGGVQTDRVTDFSLFPFTAKYSSHAGSAPAELPMDQTFWAAQASGLGAKTLTWDPQPGRWMLVVMNADAIPGVTVDLSVGADLPVLIPMAWALVVGGGVLLIVGTVLIVVGSVSGRRRNTPPPMVPDAVDRPLVHS